MRSGVIARLLQPESSRAGDELHWLGTCAESQAPHPGWHVVGLEHMPGLKDAWMQTVFEKTDGWADGWMDGKGRQARKRGGWKVGVDGWMSTQVSG